MSSCTEGGADQTLWPGADQIQLYFVSEAHIYVHIYYTVKSDKGPTLLNLLEPRERKGPTLDNRVRAWEHPTYIAECSLCVPLMNGMLGQCTVPNSVAHDVIEVLSLEDADDTMISRVTSYTYFCKYYSGSNNTKNDSS